MFRIVYPRITLLGSSQPHSSTTRLLSNLPRVRHHGVVRKQPNLNKIKIAGPRNGIFYLVPCSGKQDNQSWNERASSKKVSTHRYQNETLQSKIIHLQVTNKQLRGALSKLREQHRDSKRLLTRSNQKSQFWKQKYHEAQSKLHAFQTHIDQERMAVKLALKQRQAEKDKIRKFKQILKQKKIKKLMRSKPWKKHGKLCTVPSLLYASARLKQDMSQVPVRTSKSALECIQSFREEFKSLSSEMRAPYEAQAVANYEIRRLEREKIRNLNLTAYGLFLREQYHSIAALVPADNTTLRKAVLVNKVLCRRWKEMPREQKESYLVRSQLQREQAKENMNKLLSD